jgi:hypothetical protein
MLDSEFLSQVEEIVASCSHPNVQKAVFSATLPAGVEKVAMSMLRDPIRVVVGLKSVSYFAGPRWCANDLQGHAVASDCPITDICRRRLV